MKVPKLCHHKPSGRAFVVVRDEHGGRKFVYLGPWGTVEAQQAYEEIIRRMAAAPGRSPVPSAGAVQTFGELVERYRQHAERYYAKDGKPSQTFYKLRFAFRVPVQLFGSAMLSEFGPKAMRTIQDAWVQGGLSRKEINARCQAVKRCFAWGVTEELIPVEYHQRLKLVDGLKAGRTTAPDLPPIQPARLEDVEAVAGHLPRSIAAIVRLMVLSGARCGELVMLRPSLIDRTGDVWRFTPESHKGRWRGKTRVIYFGKSAQDVLTPFLSVCGDDYVFSPRRDYPRRSRERQKGEHYRTHGVWLAIRRVCQRKGLTAFTPHQLRHLAGTSIRAEFGIDVARAVLGQSIASVTEIYTREVDKDLALKAIEKRG